jgi:hydrogenase maturation protease
MTGPEPVGSGLTGPELVGPEPVGPGLAGLAGSGLASGAGRTLIAGIGNIFLADDGFGVEAVRAIDPRSLPDGVDVADYGIRGVHLAYELLGGRYDALVMVDAVPLDDIPGTLAVLDVSGYSRRAEFADWAGIALDAHSMQPEAVLAALHNLGGAIGRVFVVGCQPAALEEGIGLTPQVAAAVPAAVALVRELVATRAAPAGGPRVAR